MRKWSALPGRFLSPEETARVREAIARAEERTSGEIRVVVSRKVKGELMDAARELFQRMEMHRTAGRNGVLILLATATRGFAVLGDEGIHRAMGQGWWDGIRDRMAESFREGDFAGGLEQAVEEVGRTLAERFPRRPGDVNELPDEVVQE